MKRPADYYLHRYWRDLSDEEKKRLDNEDERDQPLWLDSSIRGDWGDWEENYQEYERILDREIRKQLGKLIDWSDAAERRTPNPYGKRVGFCYLYLLKPEYRREDWVRIPWDELGRRWKSLLRKEGFRDSDLMDSGSALTVVADLFGSKWNDDSFLPSSRLRNLFEVAFFPSDDGRLTINVCMGPFYNAHALKLDKAIPKAVKVIRQMTLEIQKEADKINNEDSEDGW